MCQLKINIETCETGARERIENKIGRLDRMVTEICERTFNL